MPDTALPDTTVITESFWTPNVRQQVITTCTSATRPTAVEGRVIFETDTDLLLAYDGSAWVPFAGPTTGGTSYTPTLSQGASTNIAKTVNYSEYSYVGFKRIHWTFDIASTAAGTAGSPVTLTIPLTASAATAVTGAGLLLDTGTASHGGSWRGASTTTVRFESDATAFAGWGATPNLAAASGDTYVGSITYEIA